MKITDNFSLNEFNSRDGVAVPYKYIPNIVRLADQLQIIRDSLGSPVLHLTSGYRTKSHNKKVGGVKSSSHTKGLAVDIACVDSRSRFIIINALEEVGFNRLGIGKTFIHCDIDIDKPKNVYWLY